jgi:hypothetical protein
MIAYLGPILFYATFVGFFFLVERITLLEEMLKDQEQESTHEKYKVFQIERRKGNE